MHTIECVLIVVKHNILCLSALEHVDILWITWAKVLTAKFYGLWLKNIIKNKKLIFFTTIYYNVFLLIVCN